MAVVVGELGVFEGGVFEHVGWGCGLFHGLVGRVLVLRYFLHGCFVWVGWEVLSCVEGVVCAFRAQRAPLCHWTAVRFDSELPS